MNFYINLSEDNTSENKENNDNVLLREIEKTKYNKMLIYKVIEKCKKNNNLYYNSYKNTKNEEEYALNILLNLMNIKLFYENSILFNYFFQGLKVLLPNFNKLFSFFNNNTENKLLNFIRDLLREEKNLKIINKKYENSRKYYELFKNFENIKNLDNFLKGIILKNINVEKSFNKIKNVLKEEEKVINDKNYNGILEIKKKEIIDKCLKRNRNKTNYNIDDFSFYATYYYNNKIANNNNNKKLFSNIQKERKNKSNSIIKQNKIIYSNYINQIKNNRNTNGIRATYSKTMNNKKPKNFNKL